ncbi:hypothetical protein [Sphingorhabdus sp. M41]|uniref:hypothetical protein n=1 Tax=Sphingorhabdus sp. M41 TaxID=1806885 RepID=UPI00078B9555|nr:hypothetical protein [Sphingorhabdus sp. M41]AMO71453.1 hypothetical protein AZE99_05920 [Sphingorhabdus sp. M41]
MKKLIFSTMTIALITAAPASAQLLGGSGGLGGGLGGSLGSTLGSDTIGRTTGSISGNGGVTNSTRIDRNIDTRSGTIAADSESSSNANGSLLGSTELPNNTIIGSADGSASSSSNGDASASLIGTDAIRSTTGQVVGTARNTAGSLRSTAGGAAANVANRASGAGSVAGSLAGSGSGMAMGNLGQLAASGSSAANAGGMFAVAPGMPIEDPKGRVIGYVQSVKQSGAGVVQSVMVESGNRTAELPAANFAGSGDVLVTGMSKGELKKASKAQAQPTDRESSQ